MRSTELVHGRLPQSWKIEPEFTFDSSEREELAVALQGTSVSPYRNYWAFRNQVSSIIDSTHLPERFLSFVSSLSGRDRSANPVVLIKNTPFDEDVPIFDFDDPVQSKYRRKKTFIAEAMLELFAQLAGTPGIGYVNVNDGDVFQDIYPKKSMSSSQSQKALDEIHFHKDLANHFVRPDQVYMLGMRNHSENEVFTSFVRNADIWSHFSPDELELLKSKSFYTPFDDLTVTGEKELGNAEKHPVLGDFEDLRYFENRTRGLTLEADSVLMKLNHVLHSLKQRVFLEPGDFLVTYNNHTIHAKEVVRVRDVEKLKTRWIMKTVNVDSLASHRKHLVTGTDYLVNG